jgi:RecG-like helicase
MTTMKTFNRKAMALLAGLSLLAFALPALAADAPVTITGKGTCAKCDLKEADECQTVIQVKKDDKTVNYYLVHNKVSDDFHKNVCKAPEKVTATGTVKEVDGKMQMTATKIEAVK